MAFNLADQTQEHRISLKKLSNTKQIQDKIHPLFVHECQIKKNKPLLG